MPPRSDSDADCIALDASSSIGLGHLVRTAGLRRMLGRPARFTGRYDARLTNGGLTVRRRLLREQNLGARMWVVDSGHVPEHVIRQRLADPKLKIVWIRRGLFRDQQALIQAGYLDFVDMVIEPSEAMPERPDAFSQLAEAKGKLRRISVCQAYQAAPAADGPASGMVYLGLGGYEVAQRERFGRLRRELEQRRQAFQWSAHDLRPMLDGYSARGRVGISRSLTAKARASGAVLEAGYNSVYEALYLGIPTLFLANEDRGREAQRARVAMAKAVSPLAFDEEDPADVTAWFEAVSAGASRRRGDAGNGMLEMKRLIEEVAANGSAQ
jgi:hypothetical protein